ncbi:MAG: hypothetical protein UHM23_06625 [Clostridia bacterium]|jgi:predicted SnoaL-like aldol condensation-catalyzing enzyme|nr:hypothetical protein [Clostridia bacterium]
MPRKTKIATQKEVLAFFTDVMRRDMDEGVKISEAMSAADKLYRHFRETNADSDNKKETGIVILPEIKRKDDEE